MKFKLAAPFQEIDNFLAERICQWHQSDDELLWLSAAATSYALQQGHSCLSLSEALTQAPYNILAELGAMKLPELKLWRKQLAGFNLNAESNSPLIFENDRLYLRRYWKFEAEIAQFICAKNQQEMVLSSKQIACAKQRLTDYFPASGSETDWQQVAALNSLFSNFSVIIGGPGTGKTYTVTRILALLASIAEQSPIIKLAAPTGKAAQRLAESIRAAKQQLNLDLWVADAIPDEAMTLHRLLGAIPNQLQFRHTADNPIEADILLVDEVSMVDLPMMARLLRATKASTRVILLGDADQLPSVAAGSLLAELVEKPHLGYSKKRLDQFQKISKSLRLAEQNQAQDYVAELKISRRFADGSGIGQLALQVIAGNEQAALNCFNQHEDIHWLGEADLTAHIQNWVSAFYRPIGQAKTIEQAFCALKAFRILCATRDGERGVEAINQRIGAIFNINQQTFYRGQPIMVNQNHYGVRLYNGDIGLVWPNEQGHLMAWFEQEDGYRQVALGRLPSVETVYAMTIHKTQGSEFTHVAMLLPEVSTQGLCRELIYTGLTRAKQSFVCLGNEKVWREAVKNKVSRWSGLAEKIRQAAK